MQKGFTLIELLILIVIVGILMGIVGTTLFKTEKNIEVSREFSVEKVEQICPNGVEEAEYDKFSGHLERVRCK